MTDYRAVMDLVLKDWSVRQITASMGCSHSTVQKIRKMLQSEQITTAAQIAGLNDEAVVDSRFRVVGTRAPRTRYCGGSAVSIPGPQQWWWDILGSPGPERSQQPKTH